MDDSPQNLIELLTLTEISRRTGTVLTTMRRAVTRHGVKPDAVLIEGPHRRVSPLFVEPRIKELAKLVGIKRP